MHTFIEKYLTIHEQNVPKKQLLLYILLAYSFGVAIRFILYFQIADIDSFWLSGNPLPIYSADAGLYGFYAKQLLAGVSYPFVAEYMPGYLLYAIVKLTGFSLDWVLFLTPAFIVPLIVIPLILLFSSMRLANFGFLASLIAVSGINYYTRSYIGYMDTDILNILIPLFLIYSMMQVSHTNNVNYSLIGVLSLLAYSLWYHSSIAISASMVLFFFFATLLFYTKNVASYQAFFLFSIALLPTPYAIVIALALFALFTLSNQYKPLDYKIYLGIILLAAITTPLLLDTSHYYERALNYLDKGEMTLLHVNNQVYHFQSTLKTVSEATGASLLSPNELYSFVTTYTIMATIGFILLVTYKRAFIFLAPLLVLGYLASVAGLRFSMYATPVLAVGFVYLGYLVANLQKNRALSISLPIVITVVGVSIMLFNIRLANPSFIPAYFKKEDVKAVQDIHFSKDSHLYTWWDYGWPLWYYTNNRNTLVDNGKHAEDTYLVANMILAKDSREAADLAEYTSSIKAKRVVQTLAKENKLVSLKTDMHQSIHHDANTYLLLHRDMVLTFPTIASFADTNPLNGEEQNTRELYLSSLNKPYSKNEPIIYGDTFNFDLRSGEIVGHDGAKTQINGIIISEKGKLYAAKQYNPRSQYVLIIVDKIHALYMNKKAFDTFFIQAMFLDTYDKSRMQKVTESEEMKIFKVN